MTIATRPPLLCPTLHQESQKQDVHPRQRTGMCFCRGHLHNSQSHTGPLFHNDPQSSHVGQRVVHIYMHEHTHTVRIHGPGEPEHSQLAIHHLYKIQLHTPSNGVSGPWVRTPLLYHQTVSKKDHMDIHYKPGKSTISDTSVESCTCNINPITHSVVK